MTTPIKLYLIPLFLFAFSAGIVWYFMSGFLVNTSLTMFTHRCSTTVPVFVMAVPYASLPFSVGFLVVIAYNVTFMFSSNVERLLNSDVFSKLLKIGVVWLILSLYFVLTALRGNAAPVPLGAAEIDIYEHLPSHPLDFLIFLGFSWALFSLHLKSVDDLEDENTPPYISILLLSSGGFFVFNTLISGFIIFHRPVTALFCSGS